MSIVRVELEAALSARYLIESELGAGAAATVYRAYDVRLDRHVALKVLRPELAAVLGGERFLNEIRVTSQLSHPNIIPLFDSGDVDGYLYYTMPVVDGESLREKLDREKQLSVDEAVSIACAIAEGLAHAHDHGIVHRDIKPENILLHRGVPLIADFGIATAIDRVDADKLTATGLSLGTPKYMSPEMVTRDRNVGPASDIYALATVLYEMLAGDTPFTGSNVHAIISRIVVEKPTKLRVVRSTVPVHIEAAVDRALLKVPADRFGTARAFSVALRDVPGSTEPAPEPASYFTHLFAELKRRRVIRVAIAYFGAAAVILGVADPIAGALELPPSFLLLVIVLLFVGFVITIVVSWLFAWGGGTLRREVPVVLPHSMQIALLAVAGLFAIFAAAGGLWVVSKSDDVPLRWFGTATFDSTRYAVLPLQMTPRDAAHLREDERLRDALAAWTDIEVEPMSRVQEFAPVRTASLLATKDDLKLARDLKVGRYVSLELTVDSVGRHLTAILYETRRGQLLADTSVFLDRADTAVFASVAATLLLRGAGITHVPPEYAAGTNVLRAAVAFLRGHEALLTWDVELARREFDVALTFSPQFARAALWSAQSMNWNGSSASTSRAVALVDRALSQPALLMPHERRLAEGLRLLGSGAFGAACDAYRKLIDNDENEFAGWYGLGECQTRDDVVIPGVSASGWTYRSSAHAGVLAYRRAFLLLAATRQGFNSRTVERARQVLFTSTNTRRQGRLSDAQTAEFTGIPTWVGDTLCVVPYRRADLASGRVTASLVTQSTAVDRHRTMLQEIVGAWLGAFPMSAHAVEALAIVQEIGGQPDALTTLRRARSLSVSPAQKERLAASEVMLLVRWGLPGDAASLRRAVSVADSLMRSYGRHDTTNARKLSVVAALSGRVNEAAMLSRAGAGTVVSIRDALYASSEALIPLATFGVPAESIAAYQAHMESTIRTGLPLDEQADALYDYFALPASLGFPRGTLTGTHERLGESRYWVQRAQRLLAKGDTVALRSLLHQMHLEQRRALLRASEMPPDGVYLHAWLAAAVRDTATAVMMLDSTLYHLRYAEPGNISEVYQAAGLIMGILLRAELAAAVGDIATAKQWVGAVQILWEYSDLGLESILERSGPLRPLLTR
jgi:tRNA A-37 threonylcarbamoyl transferase component Bud32